jgi:hypothetical protein
MARAEIDLNTLKIGDCVVISGGGTTQGFGWKTRIKRITPTLIVCENGHRFNRTTGYPSPHGDNYATIVRVITD